MPAKVFAVAGKAKRKKPARRGQAVGGHRPQKTAAAKQAEKKRARSGMEWAREQQARLERRIAREQAEQAARDAAAALEAAERPEPRRGGTSADQDTRVIFPPAEARPIPVSTVCEQDERARRREAQLLRLREATERAEQRAIMERETEDKRAQWPLGEARHMVRMGYTVDHAVRLTGWPACYLEDVKQGVW